MKIEIILLGIIGFVFLIDFIVKKKKMNLIIFNKKASLSKKRKYVLIFLSLSVVFSGILIYKYNPLYIFDNTDGITLIDYFKYDRYHIEDVLEKRENNELSFFIKRNMAPFSGIVYSNHGNNGLVINGKANGLFIFYDNDAEIYSRDVSWKVPNDLFGSAKEKSSFLNGKANGLSLIWHQNQQLHKQLNYIDGELNGTYKEWREDGVLIRNGDYINSMKEGEWLEVYLVSKDYSKFKIKFIGRYLNNKRVDSWLLKKEDIEIIMYFEDGRFINLSSTDNLSEFYGLEYYVYPYRFARDYIGVKKAAEEYNMTVNHFLKINLEGLIIYGEYVWGIR